MILIILTTFLVPIMGWDVLLNSLNDWSFANDGWTQSDGSTYLNVKTCPANAMQLICLDFSTLQGQRLITGLPPHYEVKVIADQYYMESLDNEYGAVTLDSTLIQTNYYTVNGNMNYYSNQCGVWASWATLNIKTAVGSISHSASSINIYMTTNINEPWPNEGYCFRNVQLLINPCHYSCLTCNGGSINNCLTCYGGATPSSGMCPQCTNPNLSFWTLFQGCVQECTRTNYLADGNKICQPENRVTIDSTSFQWAIYVPPPSYDWDLYKNGVFQAQRYFDCNGWQLVGMYGKDEYITKSYAFSSSTKSIRVRIAHFMFNVWNQYSQVELLMDGVFVSSIYMKDGLFRSINNNAVRTVNGQCSNLATNKNFYYYRTEQIIKITNSNPTFTFKSSQDLWSVRDIYVDIIVCSLYCSTCLDDQNCSICQASYYLYKGQCITSCPEFSTMSGSICTDFDQETQYTSYLIKAFYSINSQDTETSLFNLISSSGTNFEKGNSIYFSYLKDRRIFGGALVWLNAKFGNTYSIPQPHYAVRVRMLVVLGDDFANGKFQYKLHTNSIVAIKRVYAATSQSQQWGDIYDEYFYQVNTLVTHTTGSFDITVECIGDPAKAINQAFCGIANYFVTVLECQIFCDACTSVSTCSSWSTTTANFNPTTHQCYPGYSADYVSKTCVADPVCGNGILELNEQCDDGNSISADGCFNCQYQCSNFYPNCLNTYSNTCNFGYYLNQFDNICYPKCGDGIIVAEEQCEDGNILPFDGCHRCMFSCQDACSECRNGRCYKCKTGWSLQNGKCQPICGNGILSGTEICDDANLYQIVDVCQNNICQYICPNNCQTCSLGICQQCEQGFKLNKLVNQCDTICGDQNITEYEECDDGNLVPYDGCHLCKSQCQSSCQECLFGKCYRCKSGWALATKTFRCEPTCGDGYRAEIEVCDDFNYLLGDVCLACQFQCPSNCVSCDYGICKQCETGYQLDKTRNDCQPICGDKLIVSYEECDDGNLIPQDGCHECSYQCQDSCLECRQGKCYRCESGWEWKSQTFRCEPICGDGLRVEIEVCDDLNYLLGDVCLACQFDCPDNCISCDYGVCKQCDSGYQLDKTRNDCQPICGDKLIVSNEECDDGNLIPQDGCHECSYQCQDSCLECRQGKCYKCESGWEWKSQTFRCEPICGDGLRVGIEVCDDFNYQLGDVCLSCQFQCPDKCITCAYGICKQCDSGYQLDKTRNDCQPVCGDKLVVSNEECDDGNLIPQDGCHECQFQCQDSCIECREGKCFRCELGWKWNSNIFKCEPICGDGLRAEVEVCDDLNYQLGDICLACQFQCPSNCVSCDYGICKQCETGYQLDKTRNDCQPICGDKLIVSNEECDDGNLIPQDGCHECSYQCQDSCLECRQGKCYRCESGWEWKSQTFRCEPICGDGIRAEIEVCDDTIYQLGDICLACSFQCPNNCILCYYGICKQCDSGYQLDKTRNDCSPICGDKLIVSNEECDDGNLIPQDGCHECSYQCQDSCLECRQGKCYRCESGWEWKSQTFRCEPICGDGLRVEIEVCDDMIYQLGDFCQQCLFQCPENCTICNYYGVCKQCDLGYQLDQARNDCQPICGDKLVVSYEECDDGNLIPQDGCHKCRYQCQDSCLECREGKCYRCEYGWELNYRTLRCEPICGDSYRAEIEECDDGLYTLYDVCFQCNFLCPPGCQTCKYGSCIQCSMGFILDGASNKCVSICGDGLVTEFEECDDGNQKAFDGCFNCKIECQDDCIECRQGKCFRCKTGFILNQQTHRCTEICGDHLLIGNEVCEDNNQQPFDGCYSCGFSCSPNCMTCNYGVCSQCEIGYYLHKETIRCNPISDDQIIISPEQCYDGNLIPFDGCLNNQYSCQDSCLECRKGICYKCKVGWLLDKAIGECQSICGDGIQAGQEVCDDGNNNKYDTCYRCNYYCPPECATCDKGFCLTCIQDFGLSLIDQRCYPIKGDGVITSWEECDDENVDPFDQCLSYTYSCQDHCDECVRGKCLHCERGWYWNKVDMACAPYCGDAIQAGQELCDDGNDSPFDRCFQCKYYCEPNCEICNLGLCEKCYFGYVLHIEDNQCYPVFGDKFITKLEQCDDENLIPFDGCRIGRYQCQEACTDCRNGQCWHCTTGWRWDSVDFYCQPICGDKLRVGDEHCDDGNLNVFDGCVLCRFQCPSDCQQCNLQGRCLKCKVGFGLNLEDNICSSICGDGLITQYEECDNGLLLLQDEECQSCKHKCSEACLNCFEGRCYGCNPGWNFIRGECVSICGDIVPVSQEVCDDGNSQEFDGCYNCKFSCDRNCSDCRYGVCFNCSFGWYLTDERKCESHCGDGLFVDSEWCDDGNETPFDGCYKCNYLCSEGCIRCLHGECLECEPPLIVVKKFQTCQITSVCDTLLGWYYDEYDNQCKTKCGDGIAQGLEQCDDGNFVRYDGCFECKYQCDEMCLVCVKGTCTVCQTGYHIYNGFCQTQCGDGVVLTQYEQCDDANDDPRDGCTFCKIDPNYSCITPFQGTSVCFKNIPNCVEYSDVSVCNKCKTNFFLINNECISCALTCEGCEGTPNNCNKCLFESCTICESKLGLYTNVTSKQCYSKCGDQIAALNEECDDGNLIDGDGCSSSCTVEYKYECGNAGCAQKDLGNANGNWINSTTRNVVSLFIENDTETVFCKNLTVWIEQFSLSEFSYEITDEIKCELEFHYFKTIELFNLIHIVVPLEWKQRVLTTETKEIVLTPRKWIFYSSAQLNQASSISQVAEVLVKILQISLLLAIASGSTTMLWGMLEILFWIHYIYLLNVENPIHFSNFLLSFDVHKLLMIPDFLKLNQKSDSYYTEPPPKFIEKNINPLFIQNCQAFACFIGFSIFLYMLAFTINFIINKFYNKPINSKRKIQIVTFNQIQQVEPDETIHIPLPIKYIEKMTAMYQRQLPSTWLSIISLMFLDLSVGSMLQLNYLSNWDNPLIKTNILLAGANLVFLTSILYLANSVPNSNRILLRNSNYRSNYGALYSGLNQQNSVSKSYYFINLLRKVLFMVSAVYLYEKPFIQVICCCLATSLNGLIGIFGNPFNNFSLLLLNIVPNLCITLVSLISVGFVANDQIDLMNEVQIYLIGWAQIVLICLAIGVQLSLLLKEILLKIWMLVKLIKGKERQQ